MVMAILHSCCFWRTVRKGSYASAIYTLIYFGCSSIMLLHYVKEEREYLTGEVDTPLGESLLEHGDVSPTAVIFNILLLVCSLCLVICSFLVLVGLWKNWRYLLLPWTAFMFADIFIEFAHLVYLIRLNRLTLDPIVSVVLTIDFFIMCLNVYCLVCVISQYQLYKRETNPRRIEAKNLTTIKNYLTTSHKSQIPLSPNTNCSMIPEESRIVNSTSEEEPAATSLPKTD